uniref:Putative secreted protein n=1 Tax=Ixodes ricinus TaxID=34613 RepID=A0A6B0U159_IXORI
MHSIHICCGALAVSAHSRSTRCQSVVECRKLALEAGQQKLLPHILILSVTIAANKTDIFARACTIGAGD